MQNGTWPPDESAWYARFYLGDAEKPDKGSVTFDSLRLLRMTVELRKAVRLIRLEDVSERPADYYL